MPVSQLQKLNDVDTRREVFILLGKLTPTERTAFLYHCCDRIGILGVDPDSGKPLAVTITCESGDVTESYLDFWGLVASYGLDAKSALEELERRVSALTGQAGSKRIYVPGK